jgi:hypothetical protein
VPVDAWRLAAYPRVDLEEISRTACGGAGGEQGERHSIESLAKQKVRQQQPICKSLARLATEAARGRGHAYRVAAYGRVDLVELSTGLCADFEGVLCVANDKVQQVCGQLQLLEHPQNERCVPSTTMRKTCARATRPSISICTRRTQKVPWQQRQHEWSTQITAVALDEQRHHDASSASKLACCGFTAHGSESAGMCEAARRMEGSSEPDERATPEARIRAGSSHGSGRGKKEEKTLVRTVCPTCSHIAVTRARPVDAY